MALGRGQGLVYIGQSVNSGPSDPTNLKEWRRCNLGGGEELTFEEGADRWAQGARWPVGGASWPHMSASIRYVGSPPPPRLHLRHPFKSV